MSDNKKKSKKTTKRTKRIPGVDNGAPARIFGSGNDIVPGEVIVQLSDAASASITSAIPRGPSRGLAFSATQSFGHSDLDAALKGIKVKSITRLHPPAPRASFAMAAAVELATTFRVAFDDKTPVEEVVAKLDQVDAVKYAEANRYRETYVTPNDSMFASQWGLTKINCPAAWDRTKGASSVIVAVIDSGVDLDHPELAALLVPGTDMVDLGPAPVARPGFRFEGDFAGRDGVPQDEVGHGTHVAGTIACASNNATGVAGVTWNCRIMPVRVLARIVNISNPADVRGVGSAADIAAGIRWAVDNGARVLNLSLGGVTDTNVERDAIAYAIAHGAVVCAAMGNDPTAGDSFPAAYPDVIAVGAIDSADRRAGFSQVGPHIDVAAPGVGILSTVWDNGFTTMSGTSMATPHVAGVAALILSINPSLTGAQAADIIRQTARPLRDNPGDPIPNNNYGFGCVDAAAAVNRAAPPRPSTTLVCVTRSITCRPSIIVQCPTTEIVCQPSVITRCPSVTIQCPSLAVRCPSIVTICGPSLTTRCPPSELICPSGPICGGPDLPDPGPVLAQQPGQAQWGEQAQDLEDPYAQQYPEE